MLTISEPAFAALRDQHVARFVDRCRAFVSSRGLDPRLTPAEFEHLVRRRMAEAEQVALTSERAIVLIVCLELHAGRPLLADPVVASGLARLPAEEAVRLDWLLHHARARPEWAAPVGR